jgi:hypothetical protein
MLLLAVNVLWLWSQFWALTWAGGQEADSLLRSNLCRIDWGRGFK